mmetsp:Transcript_10587/g.15854  ORF Transcript_10587/g.15854 Transcript_10587/m.15854 type:complete len:95 (-) Transcript_10587:700-984(-)
MPSTNSEVQPRSCKKLYSFRYNILMEELSRLEGVENMLLDIGDKVKDVLGLLRRELRQEESKDDIIDNLEIATTDLSELGKDLHDIIDKIPLES